MGSGKHACGKYCQGSSSKRGKKNSESSIVPSFSKIMCGESYDAVMVVPPTIAEKLKSLHVKKVTLEDPDKLKWDVHLTNLEGSPAFSKGWHNFVRHNGIELGDFLEFHYFGDSHFFVNIYGSNGCSKFFPSVRRMKNNKERTAATATSSISEKRPSDSLYERSARKNRFNSSARNIVFTRSQSNIHKTPKAVPVSKTFEDPCLMTSRETNVDVEDGRECLLDLSAFEMRGKNPTNDRENDLPEKQTDVKATVGDYRHEKRSSPVPDKFPASESGAASTNTRYYSTSERNTEILSEADFLGREHSPLSSNSRNADSPLESVIPLKIIPEPKSSKFSGQPDDNQPSQVVKKEFADAAVDFSDGPTSISTGGCTRPIKQEAMSCLGDEQYVKVYCIEGCCKNLNPTLNDEAVVKTSAKSEPVDCDAPSQPF